MLIFLRGRSWKKMRTGLSPVFTSGKIKRLVGSMNIASEQFRNYLLKIRDSKGCVRMHDAFGRYSLGAVAHSVFSADFNVFDIKESPFVELARKFEFKMSPLIFLRMFIRRVLPSLANYKDPFKHVIAWYNELANRIVDQRNKVTCRK